MDEATDKNRRPRQQALGQFFTTTSVADFMASLPMSLPETVRFLDAGAGAGALTLAFVSRCCRRPEGVKTIEATLYEVDVDLLQTLHHTIAECECLCARAGVQFRFRIERSDFVLDMTNRLAGGLFSKHPPRFDVSVVNPPYRKIGALSAERRALQRLGIETSNLYAGFLALIHRLLVPGGQLVAITPRSFCNGPYFRWFREDLLSALSLARIHLFDSRRAAFRDDGVLQENIIFHAFKAPDRTSSIIVSQCRGVGLDAADAMQMEEVPRSEMVHPTDPEKFIHIPLSESHVLAKEVFHRLTCSLESLGLSVSTGRVVDFRLKDALRKQPEEGTVPLLYPCHFEGGGICWPRQDTRKPNAILDTPHTRPWLVPTGVYLLTKRFTSKEQRRRLVACLFEPRHASADRLGFENHLNYFHADGRGLPRDLALGLYAFLNSTYADQYFRRFSGHTQVNATDLRTLSYPARETLEAMGRTLDSLDGSQEQLDQHLLRHIYAS
jgi:adenine-specific DNA-methyltransferase